MQIGGIDAESIVSQLMQIERRPLTVLQSRQSAARSAADAVGKIRTDLEALRSAATKLADPKTFNRFKTTVSDATVASVATTSSASTGAISFRVDRLAQAHGLRSVGTVTSANAVVTSASVLAIATRAQPMGIASVTAAGGAPVGTTDIEVTQSSAAAAATGTALTGDRTITAGVNDTIELSVNGVAHTVTLAAGTYTPDGLAEAIGTALSSGGIAATASLANDGAIRIATAREGSAATLQITGGSALTDAGLTVDAAARTGIDGIIDVGGTAVTLSTVEAGTTFSQGNLSFTLAGGMRVGEATVTTVSTGSRTLSDVARAINNANAGVAATAVKVSDGSWRLQVTSRTTGTAGAIAIDGSVLTGLGGLRESSAAQNAQITIGSGDGAYGIESSSNAFTDVLQGATITVTSTSADPVTVDIARDNAALADDVNGMISAANSLLATIKAQTRNPVGGTPAPLANSPVRQLSQDVRRALTSVVEGLTGSNSLASTAGISINREGDITFDREAFTEAIEDDPGVISRLFVRGGTETGLAVFGSATAQTAAGVYAVNITTAATQATSGTLFGGGATGSTRVGVRAAGVNATVDVAAGASVAQIVTSLNESFAANRLDLVAEEDSGGLRIRSNRWGAAGDFEVNTDVLGSGSWNAVAGQDVVGTIDGRTATGTGRTLRLGGTDAGPATGLSVLVEGGASGAVGNVAYQPGLAARVVGLATSATRASTGMLATVKDAQDRRVEGFADQIATLEDRLAIRETNLRRQYANLQTVLSNLQTQGSWISGQLSSLF